MQRELEGDILVRSGAVEQRYSGAEGLEVEVIERVCKAGEELPYGVFINVGCAADNAVVLDALFIVKFVAGWAARGLSPFQLIFIP